MTGGMPDAVPGGTAGWTAGAGISGGTDAPHCSQNLSPSVSTAPQAVQNFCPIDLQLRKSGFVAG